MSDTADQIQDEVIEIEGIEKIQLMNLVNLLFAFILFIYLFYSNWNLEFPLSSLFYWIFLGGIIQTVVKFVPNLIYTMIVAKDRVITNTEALLGYLTIVPFNLYIQYKVFEYYFVTN